MALILRNGGSQSPDRWLREPRNNQFVSCNGRKTDKALCNDFKTLIISFANLLYKIDLDDNDKRLLYKTFKGNKKMLSALNMKKKEFKIDILNAVEEALSYSYK